MKSELLIDMCRRAKLLLLSLLCLRQACITITVRKLLYQKDMSEHCRRRVLPSVFLSRNVADAHSQLLHFSSLELPYSCFISVRAELGSSIILVIQLLSGGSLAKACSEGPNQLLVYEMGETFGGYWGALPEAIMRPSSQSPIDAGKYIIEATQPTEAESSESQYSDEGPDATTFTEISDTTGTIQDFVTIELPIVNVSLDHFESSKKHNLQAVNDDEVFDVIYDVTPRSDVIYGSSILPILPLSQFTVTMLENSRRFESKSRYDFQYKGNLDNRLKWHPITGRYKWKTTRNRIYSKQAKMSRFLEEYIYYTSSPSHSNNTTITTTNTNGSWEQIMDTLKTMNESIIQNNKTQLYNKNIKNILHDLSNSNYNYSVYLYPDLQTVKDTVSLLYNYTRKFISSPSTTVTPNTFDVKIVNISFDDTIPTIKMEMYGKTRERVDIIKNETELNAITTTTFVYESDGNYLTFKQNKSKLNISATTLLVAETVTVTPRSLLTGTGAMVGRESWENVVRAAPVMAELLSQTPADSRRTTNNSQEQPTNARKKRIIQPLAVENARPHTMPTKNKTVSTKQPWLGISNMQDFENLVELQDDEIHDRVALRYLRQYVGATVFNICDDKEPKSRYVYLFNTSRIVIAINNFTLQRMTVILTPARTLVASSATCTNTSLECQLYGTRVCIDNSTACDGVPNCGAYDIYDEDRLKCGAAEGLQHNVYLAAIAFVAVMLTLLYSIHYWLKRCIPRVSEAFFVYTDSADNILNLETIMRAPNELDSDAKDVCTRDSSEDDEGVRVENVKTRNRNIIVRSCLACFNFVSCKIKQKKNEPISLDVENNINKVFKSKYSFTQMELNKIGKKAEKNVSVQTGQSLEMSEIKVDNGFPKQSEESLNNYNYPIFCVEDTVKKYSDELSILKFCKVTRADSLLPSSFNAAGISIDTTEKQNTEEKALKLHVYEHDRDKILDDSQGDSSSYIIPIRNEIDPQQPTSTKRLTKHLRFNEEIANIPTIEEETNKNNDMSSTIAMNFEETESMSSISKNFKRFWGAKNKKSKKKTHVTLR